MVARAHAHQKHQHHTTHRTATARLFRHRHRIYSLCSGIISVATQCGRQWGWVGTRTREKKTHTTQLRRWCRTHAHTHACMRTHMRVHGSPASRQPVQLFKILTQIIYTHSCQRPTKKKEKTKCDCAICAFVFVHQVVRLVGIFICSGFCWFLNCCCCCSPLGVG